MTEKHNKFDVPTTGHVWDDDLADLTNQPPKWWMVGLAASAIFCVVYFLYYPSFPVSTLGTHFKGLGGWTAISEMEARQDEVDTLRGKFEARLKDMTPTAILADDELSEYVKRSAKVLFGDNCAACHGQNGIGTHDKQGLFAPILNDDDWLYGGGIDDIYTSIETGRQSMMMEYKDILSDAEIETLAHAIADGRPTSTPLYEKTGCGLCHGADGKGIRAMGSVNLTDKIWRFDGSIEGIKQTIAYGVNVGDPLGRDAGMPSFKAAGKLSDAEMKKLAVYVYKLGGGEPAASTKDAGMAPAVPETES